MTKVDLPHNWIGGINVKELKHLHLTTNDPVILKDSSNVIFLLKLSTYTIWGGFVIFIVLMIVL